MRDLRKSQTGLSIIELMIAMFIGIFLLVGITTSYLSSKQSSIVRDQSSILEENGRLALEVMSKTLQHTGYSSFTGGTIEKFIQEGTDVKNTTCGQSSVVDPSIFPVVVTKDGIGNASDSLGVSYLGDNNIFSDCAGSALPATCRVGSGAATNSAKIYSAFYVNDLDELQCVGSRTASEETVSADIENMQILYGIDRNNDSMVDAFVNATAINSESSNGVWNEIVSIQLAILVRSSIELKETAEKEVFTLLDTVYKVPKADRYKRSVFSTTITLRNSIN